MASKKPAAAVVPDQRASSAMGESSNGPKATAASRYANIKSKIGFTRAPATQKASAETKLELKKPLVSKPASRSGAFTSRNSVASTTSKTTKTTGMFSKQPRAPKVNNK